MFDRRGISGGGFRPPAMQQQKQENNGGIPQDDEQNRTVFVANLDERVTEAIMYELFLQAGPLVSVRIPKDNQGKNRSFGFVTYKHEISAPYAMHLYQDVKLFGKKLVLKYKNSSALPLCPRLVLPSEDNGDEIRLEFLTQEQYHSFPFNHGCCFHVWASKPQLNQSLFSDQRRGRDFERGNGNSSRHGGNRNTRF